MFAGNYAPEGWAFCHGQVLAIAENDALFSLLGTTYGGDGQTTFALPDLRSRIPLHQGQGNGLSKRPLGEAGGEEHVTLGAPDLPAHTHAAAASSAAGTATSPAGNVWAAGNNTPFSGQASDAQMSAATVQAAGGGLPHDNMLSFLAINFIVALQGIYPLQG
jgi:microcystin-dependent protein